MNIEQQEYYNKLDDIPYFILDRYNTMVDVELLKFCLFSSWYEEYLLSSLDTKDKEVISKENEQSRFNTYKECNK